MKMTEPIFAKKQTYAGQSKVLELKKQKRSIDASVLKIEKELEKLFDNAGTDCLEIELGMLVRRKRDVGYEWVIEI